MPKREDEFWAGIKGQGRGLCPFCGSSNIYYNGSYKSWKYAKCEKNFPTPSYGPGGDFGKEARWFGKTTEGERRREFAEASHRNGESKSRDEHPTSNIQPEPADKTKTSNTGKRQVNRPIQNWLWALLLIFALSIIGLGINIYIGSFIPFWLLLGFSCIYSVEKWFSYTTRKHKGIGKSYRLLLNLCILSLFGLLIWSGIKLFSQKLSSGPLFGSLIFLAEFVFFIWMWRVVSKNSWRWPSMKLTVFSLIALSVVLAFAGVQPISTYKDTALTTIKSAFSGISSGNQREFIHPNISATPVQPTATNPVAPSQVVTPTPNSSYTINSHTGVYKNHYLGLVYTSGGPLAGSGCYGEFIVLINNKDAVNPTYSELVNFLQRDRTDQFPYQYNGTLPGMYYGTAESHIDLTCIKNIIDGTAQPNPPQICADFAERLHNDAEMAGIRCAYVSLDMVGYSDPYNLGIASNAGHACNAFETIDRGLVYIDCTGNLGSGGPDNNDMIVDVQIGREYVPRFVFPSGGWTVDSMGTVTGIFMTWDGSWHN